MINRERKKERKKERMRKNVKTKTSKEYLFIGVNIWEMICAWDQLIIKEELK